MIESINVKLGGNVITCTVEELKAFQEELNKLFPKHTVPNIVGGPPSVTPPITPNSPNGWPYYPPGVRDFNPNYPYTDNIGDNKTLIKSTELPLTAT
jgi:hypothetical protein